MVRETLRRLAIAATLALLGACGALAQSSPGLIFGQVPTAAQWNSFFAAKQDFPLGNQINIPLINGGGGATSTLTLQSTSAIGTTDAIILQTGAQIRALTITSSQQLLVGPTGSNVTQSGSNSPAIQISNTGSSSSSMGLTRFVNTGNSPTFFLSKSRGATIGSFTIVQTNDFLGGITFAGADGTQLVAGVQINAQVDNTPSAGVMPGNITIYTTPGTGGSPLERFRVDSKGHVGFSNSTPTANTCTGFALGAGSSDVAGSVTYTSATTCSINFGGGTYTNAPKCNVTPGSAASTVLATTTTGVLSVTFGTAQTAFAYSCFGF